MDVPISRIRRRDYQARKKRDPEKQARLNESVKLHGILQPLLVKPAGEFLDLLAGEGRLIAAIATGMEKVPVMVWEGAAGLDTVLQVIENDIRSELTDADLVTAVMDIAASNPDWPKKEIGRQLSLHETVISKMFTVNERAIPAVKEAFFGGAFRLGTAYEIAVEPPEVQREMVAAKIAGGGREEMKAIARKARNGTPKVKMSRVTIPLLDASIVIKGSELCMAEVVNILADALKEARRASEQYDVKTFQSMMKDKSAKGGA